MLSLVGDRITINGTSFTGTTSVTFNGLEATTFTVSSNTRIRATVPTGASTGVINVTTPLGTAVSSSSFTVAGLIPRQPTDLWYAQARPETGTEAESLADAGVVNSVLEIETVAGPASANTSATPSTRRGREPIA